MTERLLTVDQVAELVQLGPESVRRATRSGALRASRIGGRLRIRPEAVDEWVSDREVKPSRPPLILPPAPSADSLDDLMERYRPAA